MGTVQGPLIYRPAVHAEHIRVSARLSLTKAKLGSGFWGYKGRWRGAIRVGALSSQRCERKGGSIYCSSNSSSDGNGSMAGNSNENDGEFLNSSVIEAVEVRSGSNGFLIKMRDGRHLTCFHNNPLGGHLPVHTPHPAIVLKMEDESDLLLPIFVLDMPSMLLMAAVRNVQIARPTIYEIMQEMIEKMGYVVQRVRVTRRVRGAYFAQLYLTKVGNEKDRVTFDLRPSDAINIAVRCKVPIQVNRVIAYNDGLRVIEPTKLAVQAPLSDGLLSTELDRSDGQPCVETKEFDMVRNMLIAAVEERYGDAAQWREKLNQLRSKRRN